MLERGRTIVPLLPRWSPALPLRLGKPCRVWLVGCVSVCVCEERLRGQKTGLYLLGELGPGPGQCSGPLPQRIPAADLTSPRPQV